MAHGQTLRQQSRKFQDVVATWRFVPTDETCIERHHAQVSVQKKSRRHMGAVAVSLSNRWQSVEAYAENLDRQNVLLASFSEARNLPLLPARLGVGRHPMIQRCLSLLQLQRRRKGVMVWLSEEASTRGWSDGVTSDFSSVTLALRQAETHQTVRSRDNPSIAIALFAKMIRVSEKSESLRENCQPGPGYTQHKEIDSESESLTGRKDREGGREREFRERERETESLQTLRSVTH